MSLKTFRLRVALMIMLLVALIYAVPTATAWRAHFSNSTMTVYMDKTFSVELTLTEVDTTQSAQEFRLEVLKPHLAHILTNGVIPMSKINSVTRTWRGNVTIYANFLGATNVTVQLHESQTNHTVRSPNELKLIIRRPERFIDHAFVGSVILLISLLFINFGAALDLGVLRSLILRPVGPIIGFLTQFVVMPLLSYGLGVLIFPDAPELQLGLFFTGVSPSGGASNTWTVVLGGNINLSVLMTTISNLAAFIMMPLWIFTLGRLIFERGQMQVPFVRIGSMAAGLIIPLLIGLAIQRYAPRLARWLVRLLKPISTCLILFIVVFAIAVNYYLFKLFSWQIVVSGLALPWLGYALAWFVAKCMRQNNADALTIAIETGIQNTGIAIFLLTVSGLPQPQADLTTVVPVSVAIMTPLPLLCLYIYKRCARIRDGEQVEPSLIDK